MYDQIYVQKRNWPTQFRICNFDNVLGRNSHPCVDLFYIVDFHSALTSQMYGGVRGERKFRRINPQILTEQVRIHVPLHDICILYMCQWCMCPFINDACIYNACIYVLRVYDACIYVEQLYGALIYDVYIYDVYMIYNVCIFDACIYNAHIHGTVVYEPMYLRRMYLWCMMHDAHINGTCIYEQRSAMHESLMRVSMMQISMMLIWLVLRCWGKSSMVCQQKSDALYCTEMLYW